MKNNRQIKEGYIRLFTILLSLISFIALWVRRDVMIYSKVPIELPELLHQELLFDVILFVLMVFCFIAILQLLFRPPHISNKFRKAVERAGLKNSKGEYPSLYLTFKDGNVIHGSVYVIRNVGIPLAEFEDKISQLETSLNVKIHQIHYGKSKSITMLSILPSKHDKPTEITQDNYSIGKSNIQRLINILVVGATGTGKTVAIKVLMSKIVRYQPNAQFWIIDFKQQDFTAFSDCQHYYGYSECVQGLNDYYNAFKSQQRQGTADVPNYLIIDELGAFILSQEKKIAEQIKSQIAEILMLGRSYLFRPIIGLQRANAELFTGGTRDNFSHIVALGNLSKEQKSMLFADYKEQMTNLNKIGEGYLLVDGIGFEHVKFEKIRDITALDDNIRKAMCNKSDRAEGEAERRSSHCLSPLGDR